MILLPRKNTHNRLTQKQTTTKQHQSSTPELFRPPQPKRTWQQQTLLSLPISLSHRHTHKNSNKKNHKTIK
jgi:hypothetical protein